MIPMESMYCFHELYECLTTLKMLLIVTYVCRTRNNILQHVFVNLVSTKKIIGSINSTAYILYRTKSVDKSFELFVS